MFAPTSKSGILITGSAMKNTHQSDSLVSGRRNGDIDGVISRGRVRPRGQRHMYLDTMGAATRDPSRPRIINQQAPKTNLSRQETTHPAPTSTKREAPDLLDDEAGWLALDMRIPGASYQLRRHARLRRRRLVQNWAFRSIAMILILFVGTGGWLFMQVYTNMHRAFDGGGTTAVALQKKVDPNLLKGEGDGRVNILLLGNGGDGHKAPDLTDTIMLASIDPVNGKVALVSVPRDLWITLPGHGTMKINAAYQTGKFDYLGRIDSSNASTKAVQAGFATADQAVEQVLGVSIHYNALVNFRSFRQAVDTVGGVTVNVPETLVDPTIAWENGWNSTIAKQGTQEFTGKEALLYVRSRHTSSDFARSNRQRAVLTALKDKVVTLGTLSNPLKISSLLNTFGSNVRTDLTVQEASRVYEIIKDIPDKDVASVGLGDGNKLVRTGRAGTQSIVMPMAGLGVYDEIHDYVHQQLPDGYILKENALVRIVNASGDSSVGEAALRELQSYGYNVSPTITTTSTQTQTEVVNQAGIANQYTKHYLEQRYGVHATIKSMGGVQMSGADFIIVLGSNETTHN